MELTTLLVPPPESNHEPRREDALDLYSLVPYPEDYRSRAESRRCFIANESKSKVTWADVNEQDQVNVRALSSLADLRRYRTLHCPQRNWLRILSIHQSNSWRPLNITGEMFEEIVGIVGASSELLELPLSFSHKVFAVEEGFSSAPVFRLHADSIEIVYIVKYAFQKPLEEKGKDNWVIRQMGVYHKYHIASKESTLVFLHPTPNCQFQDRLMRYLQSPCQRACLYRNPLLIHSILFGTFFPAWRDYLKHLECRMLPIANTTIAAEIDKPLRVNHETLTTIRSTENRCSIVHPIFRSLERTFEVLCQANTALGDCGTMQESELNAMRQMLYNYSSAVNALGQAAWSLQNRTSTIAAQITDTLSFKDAYIAKRQSEYMLRDSTTVRVITVVTLVYLPSTFMAALLGMNSFFEMDPDSRHLVVSPQFWIYIVCSVPLTAVTLCYWWYFQKAKQRAERATSEALIV